MSVSEVGRARRVGECDKFSDAGAASQRVHEGSFRQDAGVAP